MKLSKSHQKSGKPRVTNLKHLILRVLSDERPRRAEDIAIKLKHPYTNIRKSLLTLADNKKVVEYDGYYQIVGVVHPLQKHWKGV